MEIMAEDIVQWLRENNIKVEFQGGGDPDATFAGVTPIRKPEEGHISWIKKLSPEIRHSLEESKGLLIISRPIEQAIPDHSWIFCDDPKMVFFSIVKAFFVPAEERIIAPTAFIKARKLGDNPSIGEHCSIGSEVTIGDNFTCGANVIIKGPVRIGDNCTIQSGAVIGEPGFGFYKKDGDEGIRERAPHLGGVCIGDYVEIGANTCIARGTLDDTVIEDYVKIDNLCHIAHNVHIKRGVMVVASAILSGSSVIGEQSYIAPGASVMNQVSVGEKSFIGMQTAVVKDMKAEESVFGVPARRFVRTYEI